MVGRGVPVEADALRLDVSDDPVRDGLGQSLGWAGADRPVGRAGPDHPQQWSENEPQGVTAATR